MAWQRTFRAHDRNSAVARHRVSVVNVFAAMIAAFAVADPLAVSAQNVSANAFNPSQPLPPPLPRSLDPLPASARDARGFDVRGFLQRATVTPCQPDANGGARTAGGVAWVNGMQITIPCNSMVLLAGTTISWRDVVAPTTEQAAPNLELQSLQSPAAKSDFAYPASEIRVVGNVVDGKAIAGLISISTPSSMRGQAYIVSIDYPTGRLGIASAPNLPAEAFIELNDPIITDQSDPAFGKGRYSVGKSIDARFSVDQANPTVRARTGYPMCIPKNDPAIADDPTCPRRNRPTAKAPACRSLADAGLLPLAAASTNDAAGQSNRPAARDWCASFVMPPPSVLSSDARSAGAGQSESTSTNTDAAAELAPDPMHMAPFKVGDFVNYSGALVQFRDRAASGLANGLISVHSLEADLGIFTAPGSLPSYVAIKTVTIAADSEAAPVSVAGVAQEVSSRIALEAVGTDVTSVADLYFVDLEPGANVPGFPRPGRVAGQESHRWITPNAITGEIGSVGSDGMLISGGLAMQKKPPRPGRFTLTAAQVNAGHLTGPTRYVRLVSRSLCDPSNINGRAPSILRDGLTTACLKRARVANGLFAGHFLAPLNIVFSRAAIPGEQVIAKDLWTLGFLANGEGGSAAAGDSLAAGPLFPTPW